MKIRSIHDVKIKTKLIVPGAVSIVGLVVTGGEPVYMAGYLNQVSTDISQAWLPSMIIAEELNTTTMDYRLQENHHAIARDEASMDEAEQEMFRMCQEIDADFAKYEDYITNERDERLMNEAKDVWERYLERSDRLLEASRNNWTGEVQVLIQEESQQLFDGASALFLKAVEFNERGAETASIYGDRLYARLTVTKALTIGLAGAFIVLLITYILWSIEKPVKRVMETTRWMSNGDLDAWLDYKSEDEIDVPTDSMNALIERLNDTTKDEKHLLQEIGNENYHAELECQQAYRRDFTPILYLITSLQSRLECSSLNKKKRNAKLTKRAVIERIEPEVASEEAEKLETLDGTDSQKSRGQTGYMTTKWMMYAKKAGFNGIGKQYGIPPVTAWTTRNWDVVEDKALTRYLKGMPRDLYSPHLLLHMDDAVALLLEKIQGDSVARIVGDYDIDGVCLTCLPYRALKRVGAKVDYRISDRVKDGYRINEWIVEAAAADGVDMVLTCDNGTAAVSRIARTKELGMTVIVTDCHDILCEDGKEMVLPADVIVNPKQAARQYPWRQICGVVVAWKLVQALYEWFGVPAAEREEMIELVAIATVGDVMRFQDENRIIVKKGLRRMRRTKSMGLKKLVEKSNLDTCHLSAYHIGSVIGPYLSAGGRLQIAKLALSMLLCEDEAEADRMVQELKELNDTRKTMTQEGIDAAALLVEEKYMQDKTLVVYLSDCHESLAGIIAERLREWYHKPLLVSMRAEDGVKDSGRPIEGYHMFEVPVGVKYLLTKFGGHLMVAGLSLHEKDAEQLRLELNRNARLTEEDFIPKAWIDAPMPIEYISEPLTGELELLESFGQGNEKPQFIQKHLHIRNTRVLGKDRNVVELSLVSESGTAMDGMVFGNGDEFVEEMGQHRVMDIIYYPTINKYNGNRNFQIVIKEYRFVE